MVGAPEADPELKYRGLAISEPRGQFVSPELAVKPPQSEGNSQQGNRAQQPECRPLGKQLRLPGRPIP